MRRIHTLPLLVVCLAFFAACSSPPEPVATVTINQDPVELSHATWERVVLTWRMEEPLTGIEGAPRVLLHLRDDAGELLRTFDHPFPGDWQPGAERAYDVEIFQSALAEPLEPDDYDLVAGLYDGAGARWSVRTADGARLAVLRAVETAAGVPELSFSPEWLPTEPGADLQILARRWLSAGGAIRVRGFDRPGSLWLRVGVPSEGDRQDLIVADDAAQPAVTVTAECSGFQAQLSGAGSHTVEIPLTPPDEGGGDCRLVFTPNFELVSQENGEKRTVVLENLAWSGDAGNGA